MMSKYKHVWKTIDNIEEFTIFCEGCGIVADGEFIISVLNERASLTEKVERLEDAERRAWEYARFFSGRAELLRLHIRVHLGLSQKDCIGWGEHEYRNALLESE